MLNLGFWTFQMHIVSYKRNYILTKNDEISHNSVGCRQTTYVQNKYFLGIQNTSGKPVCLTIQTA